MKRSIQKLLYLFFHPNNQKPFFFSPSLCCLATFALKMMLTDHSNVEYIEKRGTTDIICLGLRLQKSIAIQKYSSYYTVRDHRTRIWKEKHFHVIANTQSSFDCEVIICTLSDSHQLFCKKGYAKFMPH